MHPPTLLSTFLLLVISSVLAAPVPVPVVNMYGTNAANGATPEPGQAATLAAEAAAAAAAAAQQAAQQAACGAQSAGSGATTAPGAPVTIVGSGDCSWMLSEKHF